MNLIWYNASTNEYEYGDSKQFQSVKLAKGSSVDLTLLMEFPGHDDVLASKIISELNTTKNQIAVAS